MPKATPIIEAGLDKLEEYRSRADLVPTYILAMGNGVISSSLLQHWPILFHCKLSIPLWSLSGTVKMNQRKCKQRRTFCVRYDLHNLSWMCLIIMLSYYHITWTPSIHLPGPNWDRTSCGQTTFSVWVYNLLAYRRSLTAEVDAYLLDSQVGTSILNFWQVRSHVFFVMSNLTSVAGKSASVSHNFCPCNGHSSNSRFSSTMWESLLLRKRDDNRTT